MSRPPQASRAGGFTILELLVVIGIIAVIIAVAIPAIQKARESANRTQCANNLRQIAVAMQHYHGVEQCLPPGRFPAHAGATWCVLILPYLEQDSLYKTWTVPLHTGLYADAVNAGFKTQTPVMTFFCP